MTEPDDHQLLGEFARENSEAAFAALVQRHINLVYSTALRSAGSNHAAEEITQAVFIILARKADSLTNGWLPVWLRRPRRSRVEATPRRQENEEAEEMRRGVAATSLAGWLYQTARLTAANFLRTEIRRQKREQEAYMQSTLNEPETWRQIAPLLDDAISKLGEKDRNAVVLRFFENKDLHEVGLALGASEDAAKMRVNRALEKLRKFFTKRGVTLSSVAIAGAISANSVQAAPVGLTAKTTAAAILSSAAVHSATLIAATKAIAMTTLQKTLITITIAATVGAGIYEAHRATALHNEVQTLQQQQAPLAEQIRQLERERNDATNRLTDMADELAKANRNNLELLKLRGEVGVLRQQTNELGRLMQENRKLLTQLPAQSDSTNQVSAEDRFILRQTHIVDAMSILLAAIKNYAASHNGQYPISFEQLTAAGYFETSNFAGDVGLDDFEFAKDGTLDQQGNKVILSIRVPIQRTGKPSVMILGGISSDGVTHTEMTNVSSE